MVANIVEDQLAQTKLLAALILFIATILCGYLPIKILLNKTFIQHAMFLGGGVLLATAFCHLIPEAHDNYKLFGAELTDADSDVPYVELVLCCGFFFMYLVEQLLVKFINSHAHKHSDNDHQSSTNSSGGPVQIQQVVSTTASGEQLVIGIGPLDSQSNGVGSSTIGASSLGNLSTAPTLANGRASELYKFLRGLLIISAFGAHSIFDGVAIGSQDTIEKVWTVFIAISCHKLIIAAVVGLELFVATLESQLWTVVHLLIFSLMSPIGIVLVVLAQNSLHLNANHPAMILLQSFATGTLLYIVFIEILQPKEDQMYENRNKLGKSFSLICGFALMLLVLTLIEH